MAIWPPTAEIKFWRNLNLAICDCEAKFHYVILACGYAIHMIWPSRSLVEIKFGGAVGDRETAKLNSRPNFPAERYVVRLPFSVFLTFVLFGEFALRFRGTLSHRTVHIRKETRSLCQEPRRLQVQILRHQ